MKRTVATVRHIADKKGMAAAERFPVFEQYPAQFRPRRIDVPPDGTGFSGAIVRQVETEAGPFALRGWPLGTNPQRVRGLHHFLAHVADQCGNSVPVPVRSRSGDTLVQSEGRWWQIEPWLPGAAELSSISDARLFAAMRLLARVHRAATTFRPTVEESTWFHTVEAGTPYSIGSRLERIDAWDAERWQALVRELRERREIPLRFRNLAFLIGLAFQQSREAIRGELARAAAIKVPITSCPRDVWRAHVLFEGERATGLIDFAACRADSVCVDLARLLDSYLCNEEARWAAAVDVYATERPLSDAERSLIPVFRNSGLILSGMAWLEHWQAMGRPIDVNDRILARMEEISDRCRALNG